MSKAMTDLYDTRTTARHSVVDCKGTTHHADALATMSCRTCYPANPIRAKTAPELLSLLEDRPYAKVLLGQCELGRAPSTLCSRPHADGTTATRVRHVQCQNCETVYCEATNIALATAKRHCLPSRSARNRGRSTGTNTSASKALPLKLFQR